MTPAGRPSPVDSRRAKRPACRGAEIIEHGAADGTPRYACVFRPAAIEKRAPLPLVVFFPGQDETPTKVARETGLRKLLETVDLAGDPGHLGFILLAPQARRLDGRIRFDVEHISDENEDAVATDRFIEVVAKRGWIDRRRIYAVGDGVGGEMAALYAMLRPNRVAAFASYAGNAGGLKWTCSEEPPPAAIVYRACDTISKCLEMEQWLRRREEAHAPTMSLRLGAFDRLEPSCDLDRSQCKQNKGTANHLRWPKGKERELLGFLGRYSLVEPTDSNEL